MVTNRRVVEDDKQDFYPTPEWCVKALLDNEEFESEVWEPACGDGAISETIRKLRPNLSVFSTDLYDHGYGIPNQDFLEHDGLMFKNIITNPPYNIANEFTLKALASSTKKVALLVRLAFLEGQERYRTVFEPYPPARVWVFSERITMYKKYAKDKKGSGTTAYCWVVWDTDHVGPTETKWLKPIYKP